MSDAIDGAMDTGDVEEEASNVYSQICDEIGVEQNEDMEVRKDKVKVEGEVKVVRFIR